MGGSDEVVVVGVVSPTPRGAGLCSWKKNRKCCVCLEDLPRFVCPEACLLGHVGKSRYRRDCPGDKDESLIVGSVECLSLVFVVVYILDPYFRFRAIY